MPLARARRRGLDLDDFDAPVQATTARGRRRPADWGDPEQALSRSASSSTCWSSASRSCRRRPARVFMMREVMELESDEICKELTITANNLWVILYRARMSLRECLEQHWFAGGARRRGPPDAARRACPTMSTWLSATSCPARTSSRLLSRAQDARAAGVRSAGGCAGTSPSARMCSRFERSCAFLREAVRRYKAVTSAGIDHDRRQRRACARSTPRPPTVAELVRALALEGKRIAVERNGEIVPRSRYGETRRVGRRPRRDRRRGRRRLTRERPPGVKSTHERPGTRRDRRSAGHRGPRVPLAPARRHRQVPRLRRRRARRSSPPARRSSPSRSAAPTSARTPNAPSLLDALPPSEFTYLPNSAGCYTADDAVRTLKLARELLDGHALSQARGAGRRDIAVSRTCAQTIDGRRAPGRATASR